MTYLRTFVQIRLQICVDTFLQIAIHDGTQVDTRPLNVLFNALKNCRTLKLKSAMSS